MITAQEATERSERSRDPVLRNLMSMVEKIIIDATSNNKYCTEFYLGTMFETLIIKEVFEKQGFKVEYTYGMRDGYKIYIDWGRHVH